MAGNRFVIMASSLCLWMMPMHCLCRLLLIGLLAAFALPALLAQPAAGPFIPRDRLKLKDGTSVDVRPLPQWLRQPPTFEGTLEFQPLTNDGKPGDSLTLRADELAA